MIAASEGQSRQSREQTALARVWTLVGLTSDLRRDGDWITADLWGRAIFVQRFGHDLRGYRNACAHRLYPLHRGRRGNGPLRCAFHGWVYDAEGRARDIPMCRELFGRSPQELDRRLTPVAIDTCGPLVFARMMEGEGDLGLEAFLGDLAPIIRTMTAAMPRALPFDLPMACDWKQSVHLSLDDYHLPAVHADTFGAHGHLGVNWVHYYRADPHSAYFGGSDLNDDAMRDMAAACGAGHYDPSGYRTFHIFPNLTLMHYRVFGRWVALLQQYAPAGEGRSVLRNWLMPLASRDDRSLGRRWLNGIADWPRQRVIRMVARHILRQDQVIAEGLETVRHPPGRPLLGAHEKRIAWFDAACAAAFGGPPDPQS